MTSPDPSAQLVLHEYAASGNCYKIRLTAAWLGVPLERRQYDILAGATRTPAFLAQVNPAGRIPTLQVGERFLPESNAACSYLAAGSRLIPRDRFDQADMLRWLFWEQYSHEPHIATLRFWLAFVGEGALSTAQRAAIPDKRAAGAAALRLMDDHLAGRDWFVGAAPSLADIALYAYTHVAEAGGFALAEYRNVRGWLARVAQQPGYVGMAA